VNCQYDAHGMRTDLGHDLCTADMMDLCNNARCKHHGTRFQPGDSFDAWQREVARCSVHPTEGTDLMVKDALGLAGETGEVVELIKKARFHARPLDVALLREEIGDVLWYLTDLCAQAGFTLADAAQVNAAKLRKRYPDGFTLGGGVR
jgi:NTP pyrophosphatase (non-canonical NTP hydrolase)